MKLKTNDKMQVQTISHLPKGLEPYEEIVKGKLNWIIYFLIIQGSDVPNGGAVIAEISPLLHVNIRFESTPPSFEEIFLNALLKFQF